MNPKNTGWHLMTGSLHWFLKVSPNNCNINIPYIKNNQRVVWSLFSWLFFNKEWKIRWMDFKRLTWYTNWAIVWREILGNLETTTAERETSPKTYYHMLPLIGVIVGWHLTNIESFSLDFPKWSLPYLSRHARSMSVIPPVKNADFCVHRCPTADKCPKYQCKHLAISRTIQTIKPQSRHRRRALAKSCTFKHHDSTHFSAGIWVNKKRFTFVLTWSYIPYYIQPFAVNQSVKDI